MLSGALVSLFLMTSETLVETRPGFCVFVNVGWWSKVTWRLLCWYEKWLCDQWGGMWLQRRLPRGHGWSALEEMHELEYQIVIEGVKLPSRSYIFLALKNRAKLILLSINYTSYFLYKNDFFKKQGWDSADLLNIIKKHLTKRLRLSRFWLFL